MSIRHALLALLSEGPKYGLQLREEFEANTGQVWPLNVGQVYTTLQRLERDGFVASEGDEDTPQKGYRITEEGRDELDVWLLTPPDLISMATLAVPLLLLYEGAIWAVRIVEKKAQAQAAAGAAAAPAKPAE